VHLLEVRLQQEEVLMETHLQEALAILLPGHQEVVQAEAVQQEVHLLEVRLHQEALHPHQEVLHLQVEEEITKILFN